MKIQVPKINWSKPEMNKAFFVKVLIGVLVVSNLFFIIRSSVKAKRHKREKQELVEAYEMKLTENTKKQLQLVTKTFVWSIRSEMLRDNYDQMDLYFNQLVKEDDRVTEIIAVNQKGKMVVSTNKRYEGKAFKSIYNENMLQQNNVTITQDGEVFKIVAPILALNSRIGTLFMLYKPDEEMLRILDDDETIKQEEEQQEQQQADTTNTEN